MGSGKLQSRRLSETLSNAVHMLETTHSAPRLWWGRHEGRGVWLQALIWMEAPFGWCLVLPSPRHVLAEWGSLKATLEAVKVQISSMEKQMPHVGVLNCSSEIHIAYLESSGARLDQMPGLKAFHCPLVVLDVNIRMK